MMIDTGEELDIAYVTTDSLIVTTQIDGHIVVARLDTEPICVTPDILELDTKVFAYITAVSSVLAVIVNGYT